MTRSSRHRLPHGLLALFVPLALVAAACGGDDDDLSSAIDAAQDQADEATVPTEAPASGDETDATASDAEVTMPDITMPDLDDISLPDNLPMSEDCQELYGKFLTAMGGVTSGQSLEGLEDVFNSLADAVPDDLSDDAAILADAYGQLGEVLAEYDGDFAAAMADPDNAELLAAIGTPEVVAASEAIGDYFDETCGELGS